VSDPAIGYLSLCCTAPVTVEGRTTRYYVCTGCGQACDARPASMLQPVTFADEEEPLRPARLVPADETENDW
jgi:hypothetical protein